MEPWFHTGNLSVFLEKSWSLAFDNSFKNCIFDRILIFSEQMMEKNNLAKAGFIRSLIARNFFWSYNITNALPDDLVIEQVLGYGEPEDIIELKKYFKLSQIKRVWQHCLLPDARFKNANVWIAKVFFNIKHSDKYIDKYSRQNNRYDHLRLLAAQNQAGAD